VSRAGPSAPSATSLPKQGDGSGMVGLARVPSVPEYLGLPGQVVLTAGPRRAEARRCPGWGLPHRWSPPCRSTRVSRVGSASPWVSFRTGVRRSPGVRSSSSPAERPGRTQAPAVGEGRQVGLRSRRSRATRRAGRSLLVARLQPAIPQATRQPRRFDATPKRSDSTVGLTCRLCEPRERWHPRPTCRSTRVAGLVALAPTNDALSRDLVASCRSTPRPWPRNQPAGLPARPAPRPRSASRSSRAAVRRRSSRGRCGTCRGPDRRAEARPPGPRWLPRRSHQPRCATTVRRPGRSPFTVRRCSPYLRAADPPAHPYAVRRSARLAWLGGGVGQSSGDPGRRCAPSTRAETLAPGPPATGPSGDAFRWTPSPPAQRVCQAAGVPLFSTPVCGSRRRLLAPPPDRGPVLVPLRRRARG
jgi:hypothetical protein